MKMFFAIFCALLVAGPAFAQNYSIAKQQAKNAVAKEEKSQQAIAAEAANSGAPPVNPALEATLQNIANLHADFTGLNANPANKQPLINDLTAAAQGTKASPDSVSKLAGHLAAIVAGNKKLPAQYQKLAQSIHAIFNSSHLSSSQQQTMFDGVQKILLDAEISAEDTAKVVDGLRTIATETK
jgi:hypothetical protein